MRTVIIKCITTITWDIFIKAAYQLLAINIIQPDNLYNHPLLFNSKFVDHLITYVAMYEVL